MKDIIKARIKIIKKGQMTYYQPELRLGWWIFKHWTSFQAYTNIGHLRLYVSENIFNDYDEAMESFGEYKKLTNNDYKMTHPRPLDA